MPRTKGSLNKKKQIKDEAKAKVEKEIKALEPETLTVEKVREAIKRLKEHSVCKECAHSQHMHYGGAKGHCNTPNCPCLESK